MRRITLLLGLVVLALCAGSLAQTFPQVVAQVSLTGQSHAIVTTPIYAPPVEGLFRVALDMVITTPTHDARSWTPYIQWTDEAGRRERPAIPGLSVKAIPPQASLSWTYTFKAAASQPIEYGVMVSDPLSVYSLDVTVEQLQ